MEFTPVGSVHSSCSGLTTGTEVATVALKDLFDEGGSPECEITDTVAQHLCFRHAPTSGFHGLKLLLSETSSTCLTLLALILAIGLVVDDAIVVLENVYHRIEHGEKPIAAAFLGTRQVAFAASPGS